MTLNLFHYMNKLECYCYLKVSVIQLYCDSEKERNHMLGIFFPLEIQVYVLHTAKIIVLLRMIIFHVTSVTKLDVLE
jgi:hypothetical protein